MRIVTLLGILLVLLLVGAVALRIRVLYRRQRELIRLLDERTRDLRQANEELVAADETISQAKNELLAKTEQLQQLNLQIERLSNLDGLTGTSNRHFFEDHLLLEWRRACRHKTQIAVIMVDIDFFKRYNDRYGHLAGDECLKQVSECLAIIHRSGDLLARYGGEEFIVVLPETDLPGAQLLAEKMRQRVEEAKIPHEESAIAGTVTISIGVVAESPRPGQDQADFVLMADKALYKAKRLGRNRVETI